VGRFHKYSFGNVLLIARARPDATYVAGYRAWNALGRYVRKGEKGILILAPIIGRKRGRDSDHANADAKDDKVLYGFRALRLGKIIS
jgi:N-terminal domain of anti-restriction factor ArdC